MFILIQERDNLLITDFIRKGVYFTSYFQPLSAPTQTIILFLTKKAERGIINTKEKKFNEKN